MQELVDTLKEMKIDLPDAIKIDNAAGKILNVNVTGTIENTGEGGSSGVSFGDRVVRYKWNQSFITPPPYDTYGGENPGEGWTVHAPNRPADGYYLWMISAFKHFDGTYGPWGDAICLTGEKGTPGEDGKVREWIYKYDTSGYNSSVGEVSPGGYANGTETDKQLDDWVPNGWSDNPWGVSKENPIEYASFRTYDKDTETWGEFQFPIIWSHFGRNGMDGDGLEYVFIRTKTYDPPVISDSSYRDSQGREYTEDEYLPSAYIDPQYDDEGTEIRAIEDNSINISQHPNKGIRYGECTDDAKGANSEYPYEWYIKRRMTAPDSETGERNWVKYPEGTAMKIWQRYNVVVPEEILQEWKDAAASAAAVEKKLEDLHLDSEQDVLNTVEGIIKQWNWFKDPNNKFPLNQIFDYQDSTATDAFVTKMSGLGLLTENSATYTEVKEFVNANADIGDDLAGISTTVAKLDELLDEEGNINYEAIASEIDQKLTINDQGLTEAIASIQAFWGEYDTGGVDEDGNPIKGSLKEYIKSAFKAVANQYSSSASLFSDMKTESGDYATSAVQTSLGYKMTTDENGKQVPELDENGKPILLADSMLATTIKTETQQLTSGLLNEVEPKGTAATLFSKMTNKKDGDGNDNAEYESLMAAVRTSVEEEGSGIRRAIAGMYTGDPNDGDLDNAGLSGVFAEKYIAADGSADYYAGLFAQDKDETGKTIGARVLASVKNYKSELELSADDIYVNGDMTVKGKLEAIEGQFDSVEAHSLHTWKSIEGIGDTLNSQNIEIDGGAIHGYFKSGMAGDRPHITNRFAFAENGSGYLANNHMQWDTNGHLTFVESDGIDVIRYGDRIDTDNDGILDTTPIVRSLSLSGELISQEYDDPVLGKKRVAISPYNGITLYNGENSISSYINHSMVSSPEGHFDAVHTEGVYIHYYNEEDDVDEYYDDNYVVLAGGGVKPLSEIGPSAGVYWANLPTTSSATYDKKPQLAGLTLYNNLDTYGVGARLTFGDTGVDGNAYIEESEDGVLKLSADSITLNAETTVRNITATNFIKSGSNNNYVLLAGGGTKALSEIGGSNVSSSDISNWNAAYTWVNNNESNTVLLTGNQSIAGTKTFTGSIVSNSGFKKSNSNDNYVLLAGGGTAPMDKFVIKPWTESGKVASGTAWADSTNSSYPASEGWRMASGNNSCYVVEKIHFVTYKANSNVIIEIATAETDYENMYDGVVVKLDTEITSNPAFTDPGNNQRTNTYGTSSIVSVTFTVPTSGSHYLSVCYRRDSSGGTSGQNYGFYRIISFGDNSSSSGGSGTVTSVGMSAPTGFSVSGSPVTGNGILELSFASGYSLPTTAKQSGWDGAQQWVDSNKNSFIKNTDTLLTINGTSYKKGDTVTITNTSGGGTTWGSITGKPTTVSGYNITDLSINTTTGAKDGTITIGNNSVTPIFKDGDSYLSGTFEPKDNKGANLGSNSCRFDEIWGNKGNFNSFTLNGYAIATNGAGQLTVGGTAISGGSGIPLSGTASLTGDIIPASGENVSLGGYVNGNLRKFVSVYSSYGSFNTFDINGHSISVDDARNLYIDNIAISGGDSGGGDVYTNITNTFTANQVIGTTNQLRFNANADTYYIACKSMQRTKKDGTVESSIKMLNIHSSEGVKVDGSYPIEATSGFRKSNKNNLEILLSGGGSQDLSNLLTSVMNEVCNKLKSSGQEVASQCQTYLGSSGNLMVKPHVWVTTSITSYTFTSGKYYYYKGTIYGQEANITNAIYYYTGQYMYLVVVNKNGNLYPQTFDAQKGFIDYETYPGYVTKQTILQWESDFISKLQNKGYRGISVAPSASSAPCKELTTTTAWPEIEQYIPA